MMRITQPLNGFVLSGEPVIVPGIGLYTADGNPYARGMSRVNVVSNSLIHGIEIPELFLTGGKSTETHSSEADQIEAELFARLGGEMLLGTHIVKETESTNSLENFINIADDLAGQRPDAISLVTDWPHMPRVLSIARKIVHKNTQLVPVLSGHNPSYYETLREVPALPATLLTLFGVEAGNSQALHKRVQNYIETKDKIKAALRKG